MLKDSFFTIREVISTELGHDFLVVINPDHHVFEGHFPERPVVPGVFSIQIIKECVEIILQKSLQYQFIYSCKFISLILPNAGPVIISIHLKDSLLVASITHQEATMLKLKAKFAD
jgi:3-hydroxyacyl-[acyl-carrier-protein] dehydratase